MSRADHALATDFRNPASLTRRSGDHSSRPGTAAYCRCSSVLPDAPQCSPMLQQANLGLLQAWLTVNFKGSQPSSNEIPQGIKTVGLSQRSRLCSKPASCHVACLHKHAGILCRGQMYTVLSVATAFVSYRSFFSSFLIILKT